MVYLLDASVFIEAKNRYYDFDIVPGFWDWLDKTNENSEIATVIPISEELQRGNEELSEWIDDRKDTGWFLPVDDVATQQAFTELAQWVMNQDFKEEAKQEFLAGADPWLIAKARIIDATVVTHEAYDPNIKRKVKIPNVCRQFDVPYIDTFRLLRRFSASFGII